MVEDKIGGISCRDSERLPTKFISAPARNSRVKLPIVPAKNCSMCKQLFFNTIFFPALRIGRNLIYGLGWAYGCLGFSFIFGLVFKFFCVIKFCFTLVSLD